MALRRRAVGAGAFRTVPLGPARLYLDDIESIRSLLKDAAQRRVLNHHADRPDGDFWKGVQQSELEQSEPEIILGGDVIAEHVDDLRLASRSELRDLRISVASRHMMLSIPLGPSFARMTYPDDEAAAVDGLVSDIKKIVARRRISRLAAWYASLPKKSSVAGVLLLAVYLGLAIFDASTASRWLAALWFALLVLVSGVQLHILPKLGSVLISPLAYSESQGFWTEARREGGLVIAATVVGGLIVLAVQQLLI